MKCIGIYDNTKEEQTYMLRLIDNHDGSFTLAAVDGHTGKIIDGGYLLNLSKHGLRRYTSCSENLGFSLENDGRGQLYDLRH